jgi:hypothetical protein
MLADFFNPSTSKIPRLAFHSMTTCNNDIIVMYGGLKNNETISGDLILLMPDREKFVSASYENNKNCNIYYIYQ